MRGRSRAGIAALSAVLLTAGVLCTVLLPDVQATTALGLPWPALVPLYLLAQLLPVTFEFRREAHAFTFTQIPLVLGALTLAPTHHLAARLTAAVITSVVVRRQPIKAFYNVSNAALEVGAVSLALHLAHPGGHGPATWLYIFGGVCLADALSHVALLVVMRLADVRRTRTELWQLVQFAAATNLVCTVVAVVVLDAVTTDPWTLVLVAALGGLLAMLYRGHRRLLRQQHVTAQLYDFVKDLGPLTPDGPATPVALEQVRILLHARTLDLALAHDQGAPWRHLSASEGDAGLPAPGDNQDRISATVAGSAGMLGILTAHGRLGQVRDFDRGDVRLLETIANELAMALERGALEADLQRSATLDPLTGIANLAHTTRLIDERIRRDVGGVVVAALSVESFREVNETLGHEVGDALLLDVVQRLRLGFPTATIGRIGGGRFAVATDAALVGGDPSLFGLTLRSHVENGRQATSGTHVRVSVGVVRGPEHGRDGGTLLRRAETAMDSGGTTQGGPVQWEPAYEVQGQRRIAVVTALREALATGAIGVAYQPKVTMQDRRVTGVEALARWTHPALGSVPPDEFIALAEASGLIGVLTTTVLKQAMTACQGWQRRSTGVGVSVNVSADTVLDGAFVTEVGTLLAASGLAAHLLTLELTEGIAVGDPDLAIERMRELRTLGVRLSVDDFGTGYSSLTYVKQLPLDEVKVDKSFVDQVASDAADQAVVRAVVDIAHVRGLRVVAEGVETEVQHAVLRGLGVDEAQGYLHARPMAAVAVAAWMRGQRHSFEAVSPSDFV